MASTSTVVLSKGTPVTVVDLETIDFGMLEAGSVTETERLARAASTVGFFNLDLQKSSVSASTLDLVPLLFSTAEQFFCEPKEAKEQHARLDNLPFQARG